MIRVTPPQEPGNFDAECRQPGNSWLAAHSTGRPRDYWTPFKGQLADGFGQRCGYSAMYEPVGTVDHYRSAKQQRSLAYEWSNYRFSAQWINSSKQTADNAVLDPFEVQDDWFEILLPSLQLVLNEAAIPAGQLAKARLTLEKLHLRDDERVIRQRREWYRMYQAGELTLAGLRKKAPQIARAVEKLG